MIDRAKRNLGSGLGLGMGLSYGLVSLNINPIVLPDIPFYKPIPGPIPTLLIIALGGALVGRLAAWSSKKTTSMLTSAWVGAFLSTLISLYLIAGGAQNDPGPARIIFLFLMPRAVVLFGIAWLIRWAIKIWENELKTVMFSILRMAWPVLVLLAIASFFGLFSLYGKDGRSALTMAQSLIENGLSANRFTDLPAVLLPVDNFLEYAEGEYTLQLNNNPGTLPFYTPLSADGKRGYAVIVRFENGFRLACAFIPSSPEPSCGEY